MILTKFGLNIMPLETILHSYFL